MLRGEGENFCYIVLRPRNIARQVSFNMELWKKLRAIRDCVHVAWLLYH